MIGKKKVTTFFSTRFVSWQNFLNNGKTLARCNPVDWFNSNDDHLLEESCSGSIIYSTINTTIETIKDEALGQEGSGNQLKPQKILVKTSPRKITLIGSCSNKMTLEAFNISFR